jgi:hypothetical protein
MGKVLACIPFLERARECSYENEVCIDPASAEANLANDGSLDRYTDDAPEYSLPCNGHIEYCSRRFNETAFPGSHNSYSAIHEGYSSLIANQLNGITRQLQDGIRVLLLDIYQGDSGEAVLSHRFSSLGSFLHLEVLREIKNFLENNPQEILTLIYEDHVPYETVHSDYIQSDLLKYAYTHPEGTPWPTLGEMIDGGTRLLVSAENNGQAGSWYHNIWKLAWDTPYKYFDMEDFSCRPNRGTKGNSLFLLNHWVNTWLDLPSETNAVAVNASKVLYERAEECRREAGKTPNFIVVDFYERGDLFRVVERLNGILPLQKTKNPPLRQQDLITIPVPSELSLQLFLNEKTSVPRFFNLSKNLLAFKNEPREDLFRVLSNHSGFKQP